MRKVINVTAAALVLFGTMAFSGVNAKAASRAFYGVVSDAHCGLRHSTASEAAHKCVEKCVSMGSSYVLVSHGKLFDLTDQAKFKGLGGKRVRVNGTLSGHTIKVASVHALGMMRMKH